MQQDHFTFPRRSGLPYGYFERRHYGPLRAICYALLLSAAVGAVIAISYAVML